MTTTTTAVQKPMTIFWLVKTTPEWLGLPPLGTGSRFAFVEEVIKPLLGKLRGVELRIFDAEAYSAVCSDVMQWTVHDRAAYDGMVESLRETPFWDRYFQLLHIIPTLEDQYADHYEQARVSAGMPST